MTAKLDKVKLKNGTLFGLPVNMAEIRAKVLEWEEKNPAPVIPKIQITPAHFKLKEQRMAVELHKQQRIPIEIAEQKIADQLGEIENPNDEEYQKEHTLWRVKRYSHLESLMVSNSILINGKTLQDWDELGKLQEAAAHKDFLVLAAALRDNDEEGDRVKLYKFIHSISELTWELVVEVAEQYAARRFGKNILTVLPAGASEPQSLISMGCSAARESNVATAQYLQLAVIDQAIILAVWLSDRWREHFAYEEAKQKAKQK